MSETLDGLARAAFARGNAPLGKMLARRQVERRPLPAEVLSLYSETLFASGEEENGITLLGVAASRGWRDRFSQRGVIISALQQRNPEVAGLRIIGLWRQGERAQWLKDLTLEALKSPSGLQAFNRSLLHDDELFASDFLTWAARHLTPATVEYLSKEFSSHHQVFQCETFSGQIDGIVRADKIRSALTIWRRFCRTFNNKLRSGTLDFDAVADAPGPFSWRYDRSPGIEVTSTDAQRSSGLRYTSSNPLMTVIGRRYIQLPYGQHVLNFGTKQDAESHTWRLVCVAGLRSGENIPLTPINSYEQTLSVPHDCSVQQLTIAVRSGSGNVRAVEVKGYDE